MSLTWSVDDDGTLRHNPSGMRVLASAIYGA